LDIVQNNKKMHVTGFKISSLLVCAFRIQ